MTRNIDGRKAEVVNAGNQFTTYKEFALKHGYPDAYSETDYSDKRSQLINGDTVTLLVSGTHKYSGYGTLWIVEKTNGGRYIIGESGLDIKEAEAIENVTVLTDELGLEREYREVKRKAAVGERIKVVNAGYAGRTPVYRDGDVMTVTDIDSDGDRYVDRKFKDGGDCFVHNREYVVLEPSDVIIVDGARYRLVERKANVGERVVALIGDGRFGITKGRLYTVKNTKSTSCAAGITVTDDKGDNHGLTDGNFSVTEPLSSAKAPEPEAPKNDVLGLIANISTRLAEAERKIAELERSKFPKITTFGDGISYGTANYRASGIERVPSEGISAPLTRDDIIERAKADVADLLRTDRRVSGKSYGFWPEVVGTRTKRVPMQRVEFVVNREKRTVVALIRYLPHYEERNLYARGIAKCAPDDVFNVHIGKALALRRALGLEVPDAYVNAPKPTEAKVGDIVTFNDHDAGSVLYRVDSLGGGWNCTVIYCDEKFGGSTGARGKAAGGNFAWARIVDDSRDDTEVTA